MHSAGIGFLSNEVIHIRFYRGTLLSFDGRVLVEDACVQYLLFCQEARSLQMRRDCVILNFLDAHAAVRETRPARRRARRPAPRPSEGRAIVKG